MDAGTLATLAVGFGLGLRHALEPDHVAAVGTLVSEYRRLTLSCLLGASWGAGHTAALLAAAAVVIGLRRSIPPAVERGLEMSVALLLMGLGARALARLLGGISIHRHRDAHGGRSHEHLHLHLGGGRHDDAGHVHPLAFGTRPFLVGVLHGLAGSGALTLVVLASLPTASLGLVYVLVFGLGATLGMLALSGLIGIPFVVAARRSRTAHACVQGLAGAASLALGVGLAWRLGG